MGELEKVLREACSWFKLLASQAVIGNTVATSEPNASRIAQLLSSVPDRALQHCMLRDLIHLALDLSVLAQSGLLENNTNGGVEQVKIDLFPETVSRSGPTHGPIYPVVVHVPDIDALLSLQGATLSLLETFVRLQKEKRLEPLPDDGHRFAVNNPHDAPTENDFWFSGGVLAGESSSETIRTLLGALRQVMYTPTPPDRKLRVISMQSKESAAKLVSMLQQDYRRNGVATVSLLLETALLVVQATLNYLRESYEYEDGIVDSDCRSCYLSTLVSLVEHLVLFPPGVQQSLSPRDTEVAVGRSVLPLLLECVEYIKVEPLQVKPLKEDDSGKVFPYARALESIVLRTIYALLRKIDGSGASPSPFMDSLSVIGLTHKAVEKLFEFLNDQILSDSAICIISWMLVHSGTHATRLKDISRVCNSSLAVARRMSKDEDGENEDAHDSERTRPSDARDASNRARLSGLVNENAPAKRQETSHYDNGGSQSIGDESGVFKAFNAGQQSGCVTLCSIDALFGKFLLFAISSAEILLQTTKTIDTESDAFCIPQLLMTSHAQTITVSSATRLLLSLLKKIPSPGADSDYEGLSSLLLFVAKSLDELYLSVETARKYAEYAGSSSSVMQSLFVTGVKCGFFAHHLVTSLVVPSLSREITDPELKERLESFYKTAGGLYRSLEASETLQNNLPSLPVFMNEVVFNCAIDASFTAGSPSVVSIFDQMIASIESGLANSGPSTFICTSSVLDPLTGDMAAQQRRLRLLGRRLASPSADNASLQEATLELLKAEGTCQDPVARLRRWQALSWLFLSTAPEELRRILKCGDSLADDTGLSAGGTSVKWLFGAAFSDPDDMVRDYASKEIGGIISASSSTAVLAAFSTDDDICTSLVERIGLCSTRQRNAAAGFFREVDRNLHEYCRVQESQLSFTVQTSSASRQNDGTSADPKSDKVLSFQRSAMRALVSMCEHVNVETVCGKVIFEQSLVRIVRLWTGRETGGRLESAGLGYGELSRLCRCAGIGKRVRHQCMASLIPGLFKDILVPSSGVQGGIESIPAEVRERQYRLLLKLFDTVLDLSLASVEAFFKSHLHLVIAQLVVEKDYDALLLTTGFQKFLESLKAVEEECDKRLPISDVNQSDYIVGGSNSIQAKTSLWTLDLEKETINTVLVAPKVLERVLPLILAVVDPSVLEFFLEVVVQRKESRRELIMSREQLILQRKKSLRELIMSREQLILKGLVWELGRDPALLELAVHAIRTAASARTTPSSADESAIRNAGSEASNEDNSSASKWISSNFMYLLENIVQSMWSVVTTAERVQKVRCLFYMLDFLLSSYSPQYVTQIMATVNAAVNQEQDPLESSRDRMLRSQLRFLAVRALSKFVKRVAEYQWETLGHNLVSLVVPLIPILSEEEEEGRPTEKRESETDSIAPAVEILEWLTQGDLGNKLAKFFKKIPFLPPSSALNPVRHSLRALGVDFDDLHVIPTQGTQLDSMNRDTGSLQSEGGSMITDARAPSSFQKRIEGVCSLLGNEYASIRRVVLHHLTALLRANRELFHILVDSEGSASMRRYVTVAPSSSRGTVTEMVAILLSRCVYESDPKAIILLATCIGEVGAIGENRLEETKAPSAVGADNGDDTISWRAKTPWQSEVVVIQLELVTKYLVVALKAAPTSGDQRKIAHAIQQLLVLLDIQSEPPATEQEGVGTDDVTVSGARPAMRSELAKKLSLAKVLDVVNPFWFSQYEEPKCSAPDPLPLFSTSSSYYQWISRWSLLMVQRSDETPKTKWSKVFYACRTALQTQAGLNVAEFLLPILVLDRICSEDATDKHIVVHEMRDVLTFGENGASPDVPMTHSERQKAVSSIFMIIDTLQFWSFEETKLIYTNSAWKTSESLKKREVDSGWPSLHQSIIEINKLLLEVPLSLRAKAATKVGMHASALRFLEMEARACAVDSINPTRSKKGSDDPPKWRKSRAAGIWKMNLTEKKNLAEVLADLDDFETMSSIEDPLLVDSSASIRGIIRQKEATGDWAEALQHYERVRVHRLDGPVHRNPLTQYGALRCMLKLGQLERVNEIVSASLSLEDVDSSSAISIAVEASWRLGRWDSLEDLVDAKGTSSIDSDDLYQVSLGRIMLGLSKKDLGLVTKGIASARGALMEGLSSAAPEGYVRAYDHIVRLQSLREIEDASDLVCAKNPTMNLDEWAGLEAGCGWDRRLDFVSPSGAATVINTRLALARLRGDSALFLNMGKRARKNGLDIIATDAFDQAKKAFDRVDSKSCSALNDFSSTLRMQRAKLKHGTGQISTALEMLRQDVERMAHLDEDSLRLPAVSHDKQAIESALGSDESKMIDVRSLLQSTRWMVEGGSMHNFDDIRARFDTIHLLEPKWEKGHFQFAKYADSELQSRIMTLQRRPSEHSLDTDEDLLRSKTIAQDSICQIYVLLAIKHYAEATSIDTKHVYQALPRLLSLWFDFTSIEKNVAELQLELQPSQRKLLSANKDKANDVMNEKSKQIPEEAFYTAMAQLISRVIHYDKETALEVRRILIRVLIKFPGQAMWPLAWLRESSDEGRKKIGEILFNDAIRGLEEGPNQTQIKVLVASKSLFNWIYRLAKRDLKITFTNDEPWKGEVDLSEFVPPIQAALSITMPTQTNGRSRDLFPRQVPRMTNFQESVTVTSSSARPKTLKANVIDPREGPCGSHDESRYIGEIHFLVKNEATGDLRKDARVQDLNNVINRLMASSRESKSTSRTRRRLHLRTFAVTCLSEKTGLLEWVPNTESLKSLVQESFNPQAYPYPNRRGGTAKEMVDPTVLEADLRKKYRSCQISAKDEKWTQAANAFEKLCMTYPPRLYWWFCQKFHDPHAWYEARTRFTLSAAAWSAVGYIIGLGDRHTENILVDTTTGECVHVDFDVIFDKGLSSKTPELVPFRLTQNMLDAFGPAGADGIYSRSLEVAMSALRDNRDTLLSVLEPFLKDPVIDWKRSKQDVKEGSSTQYDQTKEAKRSINVIDERLKGIYKLKNSNQDLSDLRPLPVERQVDEMIADATNVQNLVQLYEGWMPWI